MKQKSKSWLELKPQKIINDLKEDFEEYYQRIQQNEKLKHIPEEVLKHWIYDQHDFDVTINNYARIDFYTMEFEKVEWPTKNFVAIPVLDFYRDYIKEKSELTKIQDFQYDDYWSKNGTWIIPPVVLDVTTLTKSVSQLNKIRSPYLYVDGHTRLGYLRALINISKKEKTNLADNHMVYLMKQK